SSGSATSSAGRTSPVSEIPRTTSSTGGLEDSLHSASASSRFGSRPAPSLGSSSTGPSERAFRLALLFILVVGLALRIWSASSGLRDLYHRDEPRIVERAVRFHQGDLNPRFFNWPSLYMYLLAGVYGVVFGGAADGVAGAFGRDPALFYLVSRLVTALFGAATLVVLCLTGRLAYGRTVGILAAGFLAVDLLHGSDSPPVTTDVALPLLLTLA